MVVSNQKTRRYTFLVFLGFRWSDFSTFLVVTLHILRIYFMYGTLDRSQIISTSLEERHTSSVVLQLQLERLS